VFSIRVWIATARSPPRSEPANLSRAGRRRRRAAPCGGIGADADPAIVAEPGQRRRALERVGDRLAGRGPAGEALVVAPQPGPELVEDRFRPLPSCGQARRGRLAVDPPLESEQRVDAPHRLGGAGRPEAVTPARSDP
jgi:hypothetical protein